MNKYVIGGALVVLAAIGGFVLWNRATPHNTQTAKEETYHDKAFGITFRYPSEYLVQVHDESYGGANHHAIVLIRKEDAEPRVDSEGPPVISFDFYDLEGAGSAEAWIRESPASNFSMGPGTLSRTSLGGYPALSYAWSGLYEARSVAAIHKGKAVMATVTYISREDVILSDFDSVLSSVVLD